MALTRLSMLAIIASDKPKANPLFSNGGEYRNRTGVHGFAIPIHTPLRPPKDYE